MKTDILALPSHHRPASHQYQIIWALFRMTAESKETAAILGAQELHGGLVLKRMVHISS